MKVGPEFPCPACGSSWGPTLFLIGVLERSQAQEGPAGRTRAFVCPPPCGTFFAVRPPALNEEGVGCWELLQQLPHEPVHRWPMTRLLVPPEGGA